MINAAIDLAATYLVLALPLLGWGLLMAVIERGQSRR